MSFSAERTLFNDAWRFHLGDAPGAEQPAFDDHSWRALDLPHDWSIELPTHPAAPGGGAIGYFPTGIGWYRRSFKVPTILTGRQISLCFEGVYGITEVWINGHSLGLHPYGYTPFRHDLTAFLRPGELATIAVKVDNSRQPNSRFYSGSGIYRHVWLENSSAVRIAPDSLFVTTAKLSPGSARLIIQAELSIPAGTAPAARSLELEIVSPGGASIASLRVDLKAGETLPGPGAFRQAVVIPAPLPWSPDTPALYVLKARLNEGKHLLDEASLSFGLRTVRVSAERGFELNGVPLKLAGGNVHHDNGPLGAAAFDRAEERRVSLLKAAGFNALRTSHNPPSSAFLTACDRLGMLVMDEIFDGWQKKKNDQDYHLWFAEWAERDLAAMVLRDRNHPSVVLWSIGNEVYERGEESGHRIAEALARCIRSLDTSRPLTIGINDVPGNWKAADALFAPLDVAGYNYELRRQAEDHVRQPARAIVCTESYQLDAFMTWAISRDLPYVLGDFVWSALDYLGEAGIGKVHPPGEKAQPHWLGEHYPWHGAYCGDLDITGWRKPISHYRAIVWDRGETLHASVIAPTPNGKPWVLTQWSVQPALPSWTWPGQEGKPLRVQVSSRYPAVRVSLNGKLIAERATTVAEEFKTELLVPYEPGQLRIAGLKEGREAEAFTLTTAGPLSNIRLLPDRRALNANNQDLAFVEVELSDAVGQLRHDGEAPITYSISGPATLAAIGSGDLTSTESYRANPRRTYQGRALVVLRTTREAGPITLTATAPGLPAAVIQLKSTGP